MGVARDFVSEYGNTSSKHFSDVERLPEIQNLQRTKDAIQRFILTSNNMFLQDGSLYLAALSMGRQDKVNSMDLSIVFEFVTKLLSFANGMMLEELKFTILVDRNEDSQENFEQILNFFSTHQQKIAKLIAIRPQGMLNRWFINNDALVQEKWSQNKLLIIGKDSQIPLPIEFIPIMHRGTFASNDKWWNDSLAAMANYFSDIKSVCYILKTLRNSLFIIWNSKKESEFNKFNLENKHYFDRLDYQINAMVKNREGIVQYFTSSSPNYSNYLTIVICGQRIVGLVESTSKIYRELIGEHQKYLKSLTDIQNLTQYLDAQGQFIDEKVKETMDKEYSLENLVTWIQNINDNIMTEEAVMKKIRVRIEESLQNLRIESEEFMTKSKEMLDKLDTFTITIDEQSKLLQKYLWKLENLLNRTVSEPENENLLKIAQIGDLIAFIKQDSSEIRNTLQKCSSIPASTRDQLLKCLNIRSELDKNMGRVLFLVEGRVQQNGPCTIELYKPTKEKIKSDKLILVTQEPKSVKSAPVIDGKQKINGEASYEINEQDSREDLEYDEDSSSFDELCDDLMKEQRRKEKRKKRIEQKRREEKRRRYEHEKRKQLSKKNIESNFKGVLFKNSTKIDEQGNMVIQTTKQINNKNIKVRQTETVQIIKRHSSRSGQRSSSERNPSGMAKLVELLGGLIGTGSTNNFGSRNLPKIDFINVGHGNQTPHLVLKDDNNANNLPHVDEME